MILDSLRHWVIQDMLTVFGSTWHPSSRVNPMAVSALAILASCRPFAQTPC